MYTVAAKTVILIAIFAIGYMFFIIRKTARRQLDIYDLVMLSAVAIVPIAFAAFPQLAFWLAGIAGVEFPFVVMFGMLFAILFIFIHRLTVKIHRLELDTRMLIQELSLLRQTIENEGSNIDGNTQTGPFN
jgi:hypothetical protein